MSDRIRLGDVATYINGYAFKPEDRGSEGLPIIRIQDLTGNAYDIGFYAGKYPSKIEINDGDVLISWSASLGVYIWDRGKALLNQHIFKVVFDKKDIDKRYFVYAVRHKLQEMESKTHGATMKHIVKKDFDNTLIPYPDVLTQCEIANNIAKVETILNAKRKELQLLDNLVKSRFVEMFGDITLNPYGWKKEHLQEHIDILTGYPFDSNGYEDIGIKICGGLIIMPDEIKWNECKHWPIIEGYEKFLLQADDIVVALDRPWISEGLKIGIIQEKDLPTLLIQRTARIRGKDIEQSFLFYLLKNEAFERQCTITGSLVPHISNKDINNYEVIIPPLELQQQFSIFVQQVEKLKAMIQNSLDEIQLLFDSLMQKYFG